MRVADIVNLIWRDRQTILAILLFRCMLHHSHDTLYDVIHVSEVTLAVTIVENLDGIALHQFVGKSKVSHIRSSRRTIHGEESQTRTWNIVKFRIGMCHQLVALLRSSIKAHRVIHLIIGRIRHLLV